MSSRSLTRESGSSYLVRFFEDGEVLVVNRSRIFREGRLKVGDKSNVQWGRNSDENAEGEILDVGNYADLMKKKKNVSRSTQVQGNKKVEKKRTKGRKPNEEPATKKLKSGVSTF